MGDLGWVRIFSQTSDLGVRIFFRGTYNGVRFFFQHYIRHERYFFSVQGIIFPRYIFASLSLPKSVCRIHFSEIPHNLLKCQIVGR